MFHAVRAFLEAFQHASRYTPGMTLKNAALFAFIGMTLLTLVCAVGFVKDLTAFLAGAAAAVEMLTSLVHLLASLSVAVFFFAFYRTRSS
jgi:hypothetical protein